MNERAEPPSSPGAKRLLDLLREALDVADPAPQSVLEAAKASLTWLTVDAELAELVEDSSLESLSGVRGASGPRLLTFEAGETTVVLEVTAVGPDRRLLGQLVGPRPAAVEVRHPAGTLAARVDPLGRFSVDAVPAGPVSVACRFHDVQRPVATSWVVL